MTWDSTCPGWDAYSLPTFCGVLFRCIGANAMEASTTLFPIRRCRSEFQGLLKRPVPHFAYTSVAQIFISTVSADPIYLNNQRTGTHEHLQNLCQSYLLVYPSLWTRSTGVYQATFISGCRVITTVKEGSFVPISAICRQTPKTYFRCAKSPFLVYYLAPNLIISF